MYVINMFFGLFVALISMLALWHLYGTWKATSNRTLWITKNVPGLRFNHTPI